MSIYTFVELSDTKFNECIYLQIKSKVFIQNLTAYSKAVFLTVTTGTILIIFSLLGGKEDLFLLLNINLGGKLSLFELNNWNAGGYTFEYIFPRDCRNSNS